MNNRINEEILLDLSHRLEAKYGVKPGVFHELGNVVVENAGTSASPLIPEEIDAICRETAAKFDLETSDIAYTMHNGNIVVYFPPSEK